MKIRILLVCFFIVILDFIAAMLGIQAEVYQDHATNTNCRKQSPEAFKRGLGATAILIVTHPLINLVGGFLGTCSEDEFGGSSTTRQISIACLVLTWIVFIVGIGSLATGTFSNWKSILSCGDKHYLFAIGGSFCILHAIFSVVFYVTALVSKEGY